MTYRFRAAAWIAAGPALLVLASLVAATAGSDARQGDARESAVLATESAAPLGAIPESAASTAAPLLPTAHPNVFVRFAPSEKPAGAPVEASIYFQPGADRSVLPTAGGPSAPGKVGPMAAAARRAPETFRMPNGSTAVRLDGHMKYSVANVGPSGRLAVGCEDDLPTPGEKAKPARDGKGDNR